MKVFITLGIAKVSSARFRHKTKPKLFTLDSRLRFMTFSVCSHEGSEFMMTKSNTVFDMSVLCSCLGVALRVYAVCFEAANVKMASPVQVS